MDSHPRCCCSPPPPASSTPWIQASGSAESGPFSPSVSVVRRPTTHPILGSSESWIRRGSAPMVVSRTGAWVEEDGRGFWRLSYPQLWALSSVALPVDSPREAPAARRPSSTRVCLPLSWLNSAPAHNVDDVILWMSGHSRWRKTSQANGSLGTLDHSLITQFIYVPRFESQCGLQSESGRTGCLYESSNIYMHIFIYIKYMHIYMHIS